MTGLRDRLAALAARRPQLSLRRPPGIDDDPERRRARRGNRFRRAAWALVVSVALVGGLFAFVFPTRTYLEQRAAEDSARERLEVLTEQNEALAEQAERLETPEEIERIARRDYGLVRPGEEAYAILPPPPPPVELPPTWPFGRLAERLAPTTTPTAPTAPTAPTTPTTVPAVPAP